MKSKSDLLPLNILLFVLLTGLFINPFIFWPWTRIAFELPKVWFISRWIELLGFLTLFTLPFVAVKEKIDSKLIIFILVFFVWAFVTSLTGSDFSKSFWGNYYRSDGLITLIHLIVFFIFMTIVFRKNWTEKCLYIIFLGSVFISYFSIIDAILIFLFNIRLPFFEDWYGGLGIFFGNPNFLAGYLVVTLPFSYYFSNNGNSLFLKGGFLMHLAAILLTKATAGILGIALFFLINFFFGKTRRIAFIFTVLVSLFGLFVFLPKYFAKYTGDNFIAESRQRIIVKGLMAYSNKPVMGWGWSNFDHAFDSVIYPMKFRNDVYVDKAHSHFLEILVTTGPLGLILYLLILGRIFYRFYYSGLHFRKILISVFLLFVIHSQINVISVSEELMFWLLAGIAAKS